MFHHADWSWPRRVDGQDVQTCFCCGHTRKSKIQFCSEIPLRERHCVRDICIYLGTLIALLALAAGLAERIAR